MARRRQRRYKWLPTIGTAPPEGGDNGASSAQFGTFQVLSAPNGDFFGNLVTTIFPLVNDVPQVDRELLGSGATSEGIGELVGNEYVIERIVGKLFVGVTNTNGTSGGTCAYVKAGIFVARADANSDNVPVGDPTSQSENYSPMSAANTGEPWMWQRGWLLGGPSVDPSGNNPFGFSATSMRNNITDRGTMHEGPHLDIKSVRRVRGDERLFMAISAMAFEPRQDAAGASSLTIDFFTDLRVLGALRRPRNGGAF